MTPPPTTAATPSTDTPPTPTPTPTVRSLSADVQYRPDRPTPFRSRLRWPDPATGRPRSLSRSKDTAEQAYAWTSLLVDAAQGGLDPRLVTEWLTKLSEATRGTLDPTLCTATLAEYGAEQMPLILRGLEGSTRAVYDQGWRKRVLPPLGHLPPAFITAGDVDRAVFGWISDGDGVSAIKNALAVLGRTLEQARRDGLIKVNPTPVNGWQKHYHLAQDELNEPRALALPDFDTLQELAAALVAASHGHYQGWGEIVTAAACTAARIGEVSGFRVCDLDTTQWIWTLRRQTTPEPGGLVDKCTKGKHARRVPIIAPLRPLLTRRLDAVGDDPMARLFTGPRGGRIATAVLRDATHWDQVVTALGHEHLRRHDLRHTALTWMADAGIPLHVLKQIAGHGLITTTQRYLHPDIRHIHDADDALTAFLRQQRW